MNDFPRQLQHHLAAHRGLWIFATTLAVAALVGAGSLGRGEPVQNLGAKVLEGDIRDEVEASGTVNPVITVQVGSQVSGTITRLNADFNSHVRKGEVIEADSDDPSVQGMRRFHAMLAAESRVSATAIQTVGSKGYDGFAMALVIAEQ